MELTYCDVTTMNRSSNSRERICVPERRVVKNKIFLKTSKLTNNERYWKKHSRYSLVFENIKLKTLNGLKGMKSSQFCTEGFLSFFAPISQ